MATITLSLAQTGFTTASKTWTLADSDVDKLLSAFTDLAPPSATRNQILLAWANYLSLMTKDKIQINQTVPAVIPAPIDMT